MSEAAQHPAVPTETQHPASSISRSDIEHVAALAALALTPEELDRLGSDLRSILGYVAELQQVDTTGVLPLTHVSELFAPSATEATVNAPAETSLRADEPRPSLPRDLVMQGAPATDGTYFQVPKVIER
ncbi:Asp-tRNA(Asn)/Glu-tRNA(Gln) amidotransferase subunit GatC [Acidipila sp. EB88]|uniref:Asp-tRNA(Asn)/Glu-tRNA(Gln) amidotransferase subunit GatC n=1 Tax=Acidipila sp. EB88 TaxID=2305226 RepID=UPI000F5F06DB|nr:Asp-tRNA(Asn)/Glu-tRNA(Gln) amidotransferase subunit GatC [Acidipila sp. EB88]RRA48306.1 Asp-tRNA(Asn)/Glu-tRNA(Gln) amidotransferase subunit GatC [Acidipila sp. EB88]